MVGQITDLVSEAKEPGVGFLDVSEEVSATVTLVPHRHRECCRFLVSYLRGMNCCGSPLKLKPLCKPCGQY